MDSSSSEQLLTLTPSPHVRHKNSTRTVMLKVLIALTPALIWGVIKNGFYALLLTAVAVSMCILFEFFFQLIARKPITVSDLSAAVTGVLLAFNVPGTFSPIYLTFGCFFAIVIVKQLFGGIGKNVVNPAMAARVFMFISWPTKITKLDSVSSATPLEAIESGKELSYTVLDTFLGNVPGCIGEVSALLLIIGGLFLLISKTITWHIPVSYLGTVAIFALIFPFEGLTMAQSVGYHLFSGGLMLGALFMATDYTTSPVTPIGRIIFGVGCGLITVLIRYCGAYAEGVSFAILIMNLLVWYIDKLTTPKVFGSKKQKGVDSNVG